jgi:hypothetical protein
MQTHFYFQSDPAISPIDSSFDSSLQLNKLLKQGLIYLEKVHRNRSDVQPDDLTYQFKKCVTSS